MGCDRVAGRGLRAGCRKGLRIGILESVPAERNAANLDALRRGLRDLGYVEGVNLVIDYRSADGRGERFAELASEMLRHGVDVILARGTPAARAAKGATGTVPIVIATMGDPTALVASFARPGGNVTGVVTFTTELTAKRVEILKDLAPGVSRVALLHNMGNPAVPPEWEEARAATRALGLEADLLDVRNEDDLGRAFEAAAARHVDGLIVGADGLTQLNLHAIVDGAARGRIPAVYPGRDFVEAGGLVAYGVNYPDLYRGLARIVGRLLNGARPGDLPVEQPTKFELVVNARTARALGLEIPPLLLARADEVIE